jgi:sterol desaturase/sphingolipid hydroxylase (fatty acid hydroxylase superfamily)
MGYAMFIHADRNIALRRISYVINSPAFHRWHHALDISGGTKNYAGLFPIYDVIFGSYYLPHHRPAAIGIEHDDVPSTCAQQLLYPFRSKASTERAARDPQEAAERGASLQTASASRGR